MERAKLAYRGPVLRGWVQPADHVHQFRSGFGAEAAALEEVGAGGGEVTEHGMGGGAVVPGVGEVGVALDGAGVIGDGLGVAVELGVDIAPLQVAGKGEAVDGVVDGELIIKKKGDGECVAVGEQCSESEQDEWAEILQPRIGRAFAWWR